MPRQKTSSGYRERNSTADRALDVLGLYSDEKLVWSGSEISEQLGVARSTGYRYLQSLVDSGFLEETTGGFRLGPRLFELARLARTGLGLLEIARPTMERLAVETSESVLLTRRSAGMVVCLDAVDSNHSMRLSYERGQVLPLNAGAAAEALFAWLPEAEIDTLIAQHGLQRFTPRTITDASEFKQRLATIRDEGAAVSQGELDENVLGIAAPIRGDGGQVRAAISIAALASRVPKSKRKTFTRATLEAADEISEQLIRVEA